MKGRQGFCRKCIYKCMFYMYIYLWFCSLFLKIPLFFQLDLWWTFPKNKSRSPFPTSDMNSGVLLCAWNLFPKNSDPGDLLPKNSDPGTLFPRNSDPGTRFFNRRWRSIALMWLFDEEDLFPKNSDPGTLFPRNSDPGTRLFNKGRRPNEFMWAPDDEDLLPKNSEPRDGPEKECPDRRSTSWLLKKRLKKGNEPSSSLLARPLHCEITDSKMTRIEHIHNEYFALSHGSVVIFIICWES